MELSAQGGGGVTIPGGAQKKTGHGTQCHGLVDEKVLGHKLDQMVLKIFSNLVHSVCDMPDQHSLTAAHLYTGWIPKGPEALWAIFIFLPSFNKIPQLTLDNILLRI